ncbi:hypothetical protein BC629DRAFT_1443481 [Irpex lacteus]|nr:hypothetical protein BC629DRAFT_1443481 [Irpex lacteus]
MSPFPLTIRFTRKFPQYGGNHEGIRFIDILDHPRSFELDDDDSYDDVINLFKAKEVYRDGDGWNIRVRFVVPSSDEEWEWGMRVADRVQDGKMRPYSKRKLAIKLEETFRRAWAYFESGNTDTDNGGDRAMTTYLGLRTLAMSDFQQMVR